MLFKQCSKNCYFCVNKHFLIFGRFLGLASFRAVCNHKNSKTNYKIESSNFYVSVSLFISLLFFVCCLYGLYEIAIDVNVTFHIGSKILINNSISMACFGLVIIFVRQLKYRKAQFHGIMQILQNGKFYNAPNLLPYGSVCKIYKRSRMYFINVTTVSIIMLAYYFWTSQKFSYIQIVQRLSIVLGIYFYMVFSFGFVIESKTYQEILHNTYAKIKISLENQRNYTLIHNKIGNRRVNNFKYLTLEEQLISLRKLHLAVFDNMKLLFNFLSPVITIALPCLVGWMIFTTYAAIQIITNENFAQIDKEYCFILLNVDLSIIIISVNLRFTEKLKHPVSFDLKASC